MEENKENNTSEEKEINSEKKVEEKGEDKTKKNIDNVKKQNSGETLTDKVRNNYWIISTIVLAILVLALLLGSPITGNAIGGSVIAEDDAGQMLLNFYQSQGVQNLSLLSVSEESGLYVVNFSYQGQTIPIYLTRDGKLAGSLSPITSKEVADNSRANTNTAAQDIPKSDKPIVELFIMARCPYGTQAEKGILPALEALGNNVEFHLRFVDYAMHGKTEVDENTMLYCVQKEEPQKLYDYMACYLNKDDPTAWNACLASSGISSSTINTCIEAADKEFKITELLNDQSSYRGSYPQYNVDKDLNDQYGVRGSPTLVINGVQASSARDSASYLKTICLAFNTAPEICSTASLSSTSPAPGFGYTESTGSTGSTAQCG